MVQTLRPTQPKPLAPDVRKPGMVELSVLLSNLAYFFVLLCVCVCVCCARAPNRHGDQRTPWEVSFLLPLCKPWGLNSGLQAWRQVPLPTSLFTWEWPLLPPANHLQSQGSDNCSSLLPAPDEPSLLCSLSIQWLPSLPPNTCPHRTGGRGVVGLVLQGLAVYDTAEKGICPTI